MFFCAATKLNAVQLSSRTENVAPRAKFRLVENSLYLVRILIPFMYLFKLKFIQIKLCEINFMELIELAVTFSKPFKRQINLVNPQTS